MVYDGSTIGLRSSGEIPLPAPSAAYKMPLNESALASRWGCFALRTSPQFSKTNFARLKLYPGQGRGMQIGELAKGFEQGVNSAFAVRRAE